MFLGDLLFEKVGHPVMYISFNEGGKCGSASDQELLETHRRKVGDRDKDARIATRIPNLAEKFLELESLEVFLRPIHDTYNSYFLSFHSILCNFLVSINFSLHFSYIIYMRILQPPF